MKRKNLYALALLLFLSTVAFSNERARFRCGTAGPCAANTANTNTANTTAASTSATPRAATVAESHFLLHTFIKLLYI